MSYYFYLGTMLCPVAPSKLEVKVKGKNKTQTLINEGEINVLKEAGLSEVQFDLLLPNVAYPFAMYKDGFKNAKHFLDIIEKLKTNKKPFQFIVTRTMPGGKMLFDTNMKVSLEDYSVKEDRKEGFDVVVSVKLKQYKDYGTKTITLDTSQIKKPRAAGNSPSATDSTYTVQSGDCLWNIARAAYGDGTKWTVIYEANKTTIENAAKAHGKASSSNGHWIFAGTKLVIPNAKDAELSVQKLGAGSGGTSSGGSSGGSTSSGGTSNGGSSNPTVESEKYLSVDFEFSMPSSSKYGVRVAYTSKYGAETAYVLVKSTKKRFQVKPNTVFEIQTPKITSSLYPEITVKHWNASDTGKDHLPQNNGNLAKFYIKITEHTTIKVTGR
jgi:nucleoid-associated protein YgaU